jgi:hypothetical protein
LLGPPPVPRERDDDLLHRREAFIAAVQQHYYPDRSGLNACWPKVGSGMKHHRPFR